jgi:hypothetical protein
MPAGFQFPMPGGQFNARSADVFMPMGFTPFERQARAMMYNNSVIGRLEKGVTLDQARAELPLSNHGEGTPSLEGTAHSRATAGEELGWFRS